MTHDGRVAFDIIDDAGNMLGSSALSPRRIRDMSHKYAVQERIDAERSMMQQEATPASSAQPFAVGQSLTLTDGQGGVVRGDVIDDADENGRITVALDKPMPDGSETLLLSPEELQGMVVQDMENGQENVGKEEEGGSGERKVNVSATPASDRVPRGKNGELLYEDVDADTAWDALVEQCRGDAAMALRVAQQMVRSRKDALDKVKKKGADKAETPEQAIAAERAYANLLSAAEKSLALWNDISAVQSLREQADAEKEQEQKREATNDREKESVGNYVKLQADTEEKDENENAPLHQQEQQHAAADATDAQGNPVNPDGTLKLEKITSVDELTDEDFSNPTRNVELPALPENVDKAIVANGKPVVIKKNIFEKNKRNHSELSPSQSRSILKEALYFTNLYGRTQPKSRPNYWVAIRTSERNKLVVLEVSEKKDNVEIVGWRYAGERQIEELRKQAEREDGQLLILTSTKEAAAGLSTLPSDVSNDKDTQATSDVQAPASENSENAVDKEVDKFKEAVTSLLKALQQEGKTDEEIERDVRALLETFSKPTLNGIISSYLASLNTKNPQHLKALSRLEQALKGMGITVKQGARGIAAGDVAFTSAYDEPFTWYTVQSAHTPSAIKQQKDRINSLVATASNQSLTPTERANALNELRATIPHYAGKFEQDGQFFDDRVSINEYLRSIEEIKIEGKDKTLPRFKINGYYRVKKPSKKKAAQAPAAENAENASVEKGSGSATRALDGVKEMIAATARREHVDDGAFRKLVESLTYDELKDALEFADKKKGRSKTDRENIGFLRDIIKYMQDEMEYAQDTDAAEMKGYEYIMELSLSYPSDFDFADYAKSKERDVADYERRGHVGHAALNRGILRAAMELQSKASAHEQDVQAPVEKNEQLNEKERSATSSAHERDVQTPATGNEQLNEKERRAKAAVEALRKKAISIPGITVFEFVPNYYKDGSGAVVYGTKTRRNVIQVNSVDEQYVEESVNIHLLSDEKRSDNEALSKVKDANSYANYLVEHSGVPRREANMKALHAGNEMYNFVRIAKDALFADRWAREVEIPLCDAIIGKKKDVQAPAEEKPQEGQNASAYKASRRKLADFNVGDVVRDYYNQKLYRIKKHSKSGVSTIAELDAEGNEVGTTTMNTHNNSRYSLAEAPVKEETPTISQDSEQVSDQDNAPYTIAPAHKRQHWNSESPLDAMEARLAELKRMAAPEQVYKEFPELAAYMEERDRVFKKYGGEDKVPQDIVKAVLDKYKDVLDRYMNVSDERREECFELEDLIKERKKQQADTTEEKSQEGQKKSGVDEFLSDAMSIGVEDVASFPKEIRDEDVISKEQKSGKRRDGIKVKAGLSGNDLYIQYREGRSSKDKRYWATIKIPNATNHSAGQIIYRLGYLGTSTDIERLAGDAVLELFNKNGLRLQKGEVKDVSPREAAMRDALVDVMRGAGVEVVTDVEEGQRVLDEVNGGARMQAKKRALETVSAASDRQHHQTVVSSADGAKVLNNLDKLVSDYEENEKTHEKTFIGTVANALGAQRKGSKSEYATFETKNGRVVTIRLADHNATVSNFDRRGELDGISIVVSPKKSAGVTNDGEAHVVEYYYDAIKLRKADGKPLADIVRAIKQALYSGEFKDTTGLAERQEVNARELRQSVGVKMQKKPMTAEEQKHKETQLSIINDTNPAPDDYHTWVRSIDDILTLHEAVDAVLAEDPEYELSTYPDVSDDMIREALRTGRITIYSSKPIKNGVFVTPSMMQAMDYSGGTKVFSKEVPIRNVAWINTDEGQYAATSGEATSQDKEVRFFRTPDGHAYGFTMGGKIYIDPRIAKADTPIHEYTHLWAAAVRQGDAKAWADIVRLMQGTPLWDEVAQNYSELADDVDALAEEVLSHFSGRRGAERLREAQRAAMEQEGLDAQAAAVAAVERVRQALKRFWRKVADFFGRRFTTAEEVADTVLADMLHGVKPAFDVNDGGVRYDANSEEAGIVARAKADGTYMKAPNGQPSKLTPRQWVQVRTKAFKEWFGDWAKAARIEKLRKSKPIVRKGDEYKGKYELNSRSAEDYVIHSLRGEYPNNDTGDVIRITRASRKVAHHDAENEVHLRSIAYIPEMIKNAVFIEESPNEKGSKFDSYRYYVVGVKIGGVDYTAKLVVGVKDGESYYDHSLTEIEKNNLIDLTDGVKADVSGNEAAPFTGKDKRLLSILQTDCSKVVDENGEPMVVYHGTQEEFNAFDKDAVRERGDGVKGFFFAPAARRESVAGYYAQHGGSIMPVFLNLKRPLVRSTSENLEAKGIADGYDGIISTAASDSENRYYDYEQKRVATERLNKGDIVEIVAFEPSQIKSATDNVGTFDGSNPDIRYQFVGERGAAAMDKAEEASVRLDNLAVAREMEASGKGAKAVKLATGWERGADGKWRYEIGDGKLKEGWKEKAIRVEGASLSDVLDNEELFNAYPQLRSISVSVESLDEGTYGEYRSNTQMIALSDKLVFGVDGVLSHEVQHAIQYIEGFAKGGSPKNFSLSDEDKRFSRLESAIAAIREHGSASQNDALDVLTRFVGENNGETYSAWNLLGRSKAGRRFIDAYYNRPDGVELDSMGDYVYSPISKYRRLVGEVEARNVSKRLSMPAEERRRSLASETEDVAREDQIFLEEGVGVSYQVVKRGTLSAEEVDELVQSLRSVDSEEVLRGMNLSGLYDTLRRLSILNENAYKGYGWISNAMAKQNGKIYSLKDSLLLKLTDELIRRGEDVGYHDGVLYFRDRNTDIQYSYHTSPYLYSNDPYENFNYTNKSPKWDGVRRGFTMTKEQYAQARIRAQLTMDARKRVAKACSEDAAETMKRVLKNGGRRSRLLGKGVAYADVVSMIDHVMSGRNYNIYAKENVSDATINLIASNALGVKDYDTRKWFVGIVLDNMRKPLSEYRKEWMQPAGNAKPGEAQTLDEVNARFNEDLGRLTEENAQSVILNLGMPGSILRSAGVTDMPIRLYGNKLLKKMRKHGFNAPDIRNLPAHINDPIAVFNNITVR